MMMLRIVGSAAATSARLSGAWRRPTGLGLAHFGGDSLDARGYLLPTARSRMASRWRVDDDGLMTPGLLWTGAARFSLLPDRRTLRSAEISREIWQRKKAPKGGRGSGGDEEAAGGGSTAAELKAILADTKTSMKKTIDFLEGALSGLRVKASPAMLDSVMVKLTASSEAVPLGKLALVTQKDTGSLRVALFDPSHLRQVEKAIVTTPDLELTPQIDGNQIHIAVPKPTAELRQALTKKAGEKAEQAKQSLRNSRQKAMTSLKKYAKELSKDEMHLWENQIQGLLDEHTKVIANIVRAKEKELQQ
jgi:ribosome recycling factor